MSSISRFEYIGEYLDIMLYAAHKQVAIGWQNLTKTPKNVLETGMYGIASVAQGYVTNRRIATGHEAAPITAPMTLYATLQCVIPGLRPTKKLLEKQRARGTHYMNLAMFGTGLGMTIAGIGHTISNFFIGTAAELEESILLGLQGVGQLAHASAWYLSAVEIDPPEKRD